MAEYDDIDFVFTTEYGTDINESDIDEYLKTEDEVDYGPDMGLNDSRQHAIDIYYEESHGESIVMNVYGSDEPYVVIRSDRTITADDGVTSFLSIDEAKEWLASQVQDETKASVKKAEDAAWHQADDTRWFSPYTDVYTLYVDRMQDDTWSWSIENLDTEDIVASGDGYSDIEEARVAVETKAVELNLDETTTNKKVSEKMSVKQTASVKTAGYVVDEATVNGQSAYVSEQPCWDENGNASNTYIIVVGIHEYGEHYSTEEDAVAALNAIADNGVTDVKTASVKKASFLSSTHIDLNAFASKPWSEGFQSFFKEADDSNGVEASVYLEHSVGSDTWKTSLYNDSTPAGTVYSDPIGTFNTAEEAKDAVDEYLRDLSSRSASVKQAHDVYNLDAAIVSLSEQLALDPDTELADLLDELVEYRQAESEETAEDEIEAHGENVPITEA